MPAPTTRLREPDPLGSIAEQATQSVSPDAPLRTLFRRGEATPGTTPGSWPGFRGPNRDAIVPNSPPLAETWPANGPPELWRIGLGEGHAGPAVANGRIYLLDYDQITHADRLLCLSLDTGQEIWSRSYPVRIKRNHGISRTIPAVADNTVVTIGPKCHIMACDATTGDLLWGFDMVARYHTKVPLWYTGQCPLISDGLVILAPGGDALMTALDLRTGEPVWTTPNPQVWQMSHSSIASLTVDDTRMWVYPAIGGLFGVAADGPDRGALLWSTDAWKHSVISPTPLPLDDGKILCTAGYGSGSAIFAVTHTSAAPWTVTQTHLLDRREFACEQQTPIYHKGLLYTILPKDAGKSREEFVCMRPDGTRLWSSGRDHRFGLGPFLFADAKCLILRDSGELVMVRADATGYTPLASAQIIQGRDAWAPPAMVNGLLLMRDEHTLVCLDLRSPDS